jgi:hypothetical protein
VKILECFGENLGIAIDAIPPDYQSKFTENRPWACATARLCGKAHVTLLPKADNKL